MRTDITTFHEHLKKNSLHVSLTKTYTIPDFPLNKNIITEVVCTKFNRYDNLFVYLLTFVVEHFKVGL